MPIHRILFGGRTSVHPAERPPTVACRFNNFVNRSTDEPIVCAKPSDKGARIADRMDEASKTEAVGIAVRFITSPASGTYPK